MNTVFKIVTLGCKVNQYETQEMRERLLEAGWREAGAGKKADVCIVNTCTVTHKADRESLYNIRRCHRQNPGGLIVAAGCMAQADGAQLKREPGVGLLIRNQDKSKLVARLIKGYSSPRSGISFFQGHTRAFLKVQDGCNNFCSYCKVPLVRGRSKSKPLAQIMQEAQQLIASGYREIVLTGICLGSYGKDLKPAVSLVTVINSLEKMDGLWRIRLSSIEAKDVSDALIEKMSVSSKLCRHVHIPIQSGDDRILRLMLRKYTRQDYIRLITKLKKAVPQVAITTDVLVGFPGEEERHFRNTLDLVEKIRPLRTHIFPYSPRNGTHACSLKGSLTPDIMKDRLARIQKSADQCSHAYQKRFLAKTMPVLIERSVKGAGRCWEGYTDNYLKIQCIFLKSLKNKLVTLRLAEIKDDIIMARVP